MQMVEPAVDFSGSLRSLGGDFGEISSAGGPEGLQPFWAVGRTRVKRPLTIWANITQLAGIFLAGLLGAARPLASNFVIFDSAVSSEPRVGFDPADRRAWVNNWAEFQPKRV